MDVRIIGGSFRGKKLKVPPQYREFRPTMGRAREALASSLIGWIPGSSVCDICAGSGAFALEMLSRGATLATAVEADTQRAGLIGTFAKEMGLEDRLSVCAGGASEFLKSCDKLFDIVFFDPPYREDALADLVPLAWDIVSPGGVLIFEYASDDKYPEQTDFFKLREHRSRRYGSSSFAIFTKDVE